MDKIKILTCVGTRPNFIKITRLKECFAKHKCFDFKLLHTGQHFDANMSQVFFEELKIHKPDFYLSAKGSTQIEMIADIMIKFEAIIQKEKPDWVLVPGDVNSSLACALVASRYGVKLAHIESGLRSFDRTMPEEINRILIDDISNLFFITEKSGEENLLNENKPSENIVFTGNTMIDSLVKFTPNIDASSILERLKINKNPYCLVTMHRPSNVDNDVVLDQIISLLSKIAEKIKVVFPVHPRTAKKLKKKTSHIQNLRIIEPLGYLDFLKTMKNASFILTDSGGIQEETTFLKSPCLTLRPNTERPITIEEGTNELVELDEQLILSKIDEILIGKWKQGKTPKYWDGKSSERIVNAILNYK